MASPVPPAGFASSRIAQAIAPKGRLWRRLYDPSYKDPLGASFGSSRFSDPRKPRPTDAFKVIYVSRTIETCFLEKELRDKLNGSLGDFPLVESEILSLQVATFRVKEPLNLVDLTGANLYKMRVPPRDIRDSRHTLAQEWSLAFWSHNTKPDGLKYSSRLNGATNLAIYDRALGKLESVDVRPLSEYPRVLDKLIRKFGLALA